METGKGVMTLFLATIEGETEGKGRRGGHLIEWIDDIQITMSF